jgi:methionyl-tRNA formyltransferase
MKVLVLGNNRAACECVTWLREHGEEIVGLVVHAEDRLRFGAELLAAAGVPPEAVFLGDRLCEPETLAAIRALNPAIGLSLYFGYILRAELIDVFPQGVINLHPSYLPYNRGQYPNVWSIVEGTPAGVTLHYIDSGIDTGDLIAQREVPVSATETGATLYTKLEEASVRLFREVWPMVRDGTAPRTPQPRTGGTYHRTRDVEQIDEIHLDREYRARDLINILRARTFPPHKGAYFIAEGRRVYMRLELIAEEALENGDD